MRVKVSDLAKTILKMIDEFVDRELIPLEHEYLTAEFRDMVLRFFPGAQINFKPDLKRQGIVDSWPAGLNDHDARRDWGWQPAYGQGRAFEEYLIPTIKARYAK